jgi:hypothetical protein
MRFGAGSEHIDVAEQRRDLFDQTVANLVVVILSRRRSVLLNWLFSLSGDEVAWDPRTCPSP